MGERPVGFIGVGNMGGRMVQRLVRDDVSVLGYDTRADRAAAVGARPATSVQDVAGACDIVLLSLPSSRVVEEVMLGPGAASVAQDGQVFVDLSTSEPGSTRRIAEAIAGSGARYLDAGVSGGAAAAEKGQLTLMVGGPSRDLERVRDVLGSFAAAIFHLGDSGAGHAAKLLNNFLNAVSLAATAEVMVTAKSLGLDLAVLLDVMNASSGVNFATLNRFPRIITGDYLEGGLTNDLMLKDVVAYTALAAEAGVATVNASGPLAAFGLARSLGYGEEISNTVVDAIGDVSGHVRLHDREDCA